MSAPSAPERAGLRERLVLLGRGLLAVALVLGALALMEAQGWSAAPGGGLFALGFLLVAGSFGGQVASFVGFPRLTGYLAVGVLAGPSGSGLISREDVRDLALVNALALALIALQAGAELSASMLKRSYRSLLWASAAHLAVISVGMTLVFAAVLRFTDFGAGLSLGQALAIGTVWGAMAASKAATDALAILSETGAKGPVSEYALGVVIVIDVFVLILFALGLALARSAVTPDASFSWTDLEELGMELFASVAAGTTFGLLIAFYFWAVGREKLLFTVAVGYGVTAFCSYFHYDTLLVFVVAGFVVANLSREGHHLIHTTESISAAVMVVFFATAGAQLDLGALRVYGPLAAILALSRVAFTWLASQAGHRLARDPPSVRRYGWTAFVSQAGVTLGLAAVAREALPAHIGEGMVTLLIAVIGINEMIGPVLFKLGLTRAGEAHAASRAAHVPALPAAGESKPHDSGG